MQKKNILTTNTHLYLSFKNSIHLIQILKEDKKFRNNWLITDK